MSQFIRGDKEILVILGKIPQSSANHLQAVARLNFFDAAKEVAASSTFKAFSRFQIFSASNKRSLVRPWPRQWPERTAIGQVKAGIDVYWKGLGQTDPALGVAARIEKQVGTGTNRPLRSRYLLIPQGDMLSPSGKPKRTAQGGSLTQVDVRDIAGGGHHSQARLSGHSNVPILQSGEIKDAFVIKTRRGLLLVQQLHEGAFGIGELKYSASGRRLLGQSKKRLGMRMRVLAVLRTTARQAQPLDFFGSWDRLASARAERYARMLEKIVNGEAAPRSQAA